MRSWGLPKWSTCRHRAWGIGLEEEVKGKALKKIILFPNAQCPMPYALCPMPYAQCPIPQFN
ncbi:hypothetical protein [Tolypothrix sp. VBCCA 56010]|uniref:hypothetical protein n=1 Tax=Tolypothrix sp. VBCCA 56010 TaxID=3137731 RepID=UPI003D7E15E5